MFEVNFAGPFALFPNDDARPYVLAQDAAWSPGVYFFSYLYNQAHRVHFVGTSSTSVAARLNEHLAHYLGGGKTIYSPDDLAAGRLRPLYQPGQAHAQFVAHVPTLMSQLAILRVFFAPFAGDRAELARIGDGITAHLQRLGGRAVEWLENEPIEYDAANFEKCFTVRFGRPAFIASLPDEMNL